jgi:hypothetical protein
MRRYEIEILRPLRLFNFGTIASEMARLKAIIQLRLASRIPLMEMERCPDWLWGLSPFWALQRRDLRSVSGQRVE